MEAKDLTSLCVTVLMVTANGAVVKQAVGLFITAVITWTSSIEHLDW